MLLFSPKNLKAFRQPRSCDGLSHGSADLPPAASFTWFPEVPRVGETVTLVSSSTDPSSPLTSFAWGLDATEPFGVGGIEVEHHLVGRRALGALRVPARLVVGDVGGVDVGPVEAEVDVARGAPFP